jgi:hypothetical protein
VSAAEGENASICSDEVIAKRAVTFNNPNDWSIQFRANHRT